MENNTKRIIIISILSVAFVLIGGTYSYYEGVVHGSGNTTMNGSAKTSTIQDLILSGTTEVVNQNMIPGESSSFSFTVANPNSFSVCYGIYFDELINTFVNVDDLTVSIDNENIPFPIENGTSTIISGLIAGANSNTEHTLTITYNNRTNENQIDDMGKSISGTIKARPSVCN